MSKKSSSRKIKLLCAWTLGAAGLLLSEAAQTAPLEAYARLPLHEEVALSPDANHIAFVTTVGNEREAIIQSLIENDSGERVSVGNKKLRSLGWASPNHLLINASQSTDFFAGPQSEIYAQNVYDLQRKKLVNPWSFPLTHQGALITIPGATLPESDATIFLAGRLFGGSGVVRFDLERQTKTMLDATTEYYTWFGWMLDGRGNLVTLTTYNEKTQRWGLSVLRDNHWNEVQTEQISIDDPRVLGFAGEQDAVILNRIEGSERVPRRLSLVDGKWGEALPNEWRGSLYLHDRLTRRVIGSVQFEPRRRYVFFDSALQEKWNRVASLFPGEEVILESWSDDWQKLIVQVFGTRTGIAYILVDTAKNEVSNLGDLYAGIGAADVAPVKPIAYNATDGLQIRGYLTMPKGKELKELPLIVLPHGGPAAQDMLGFNWFAQALASKGYLVLQANFRGSLGLDQKLQEAGYGEWGRKMQTDLSDGVRALVKLGVVDPKRICIVGSSYGGYAALAGAVMEPELYRCAVSVSGISDLKKLLYGHVDVGVTNGTKSLRYDLRYVGAKDLDDPVLAERSPALYADKIKGPILLIHGDNDSVVPFEQSQIMANALKKAGKSYEFVKLKSEDHWLSRAETRLQMLQAVAKFLEVNNPP